MDQLTGEIHGTQKKNRDLTASYGCGEIAAGLVCVTYHASHVITCRVKYPYTKGTRTLKPSISWFLNLHIHHDLTHMVLYLKDVVRPSCDHRVTCENSREAARGGKEWPRRPECCGDRSGCVQAWLQQAGSHCANPNSRMPWEGTG